MKSVVDFKNVIINGLESSPVAQALAGLRANEARYFMNKYKTEFAVSPANESDERIAWVNKILKNERNIEILSSPLETAELFVEKFKFARQKSKLAGIIRGSFFVIKGNY